MGEGDDRFETHDGAGRFVMGLLTGTVVGAGLGLLLAPKAGAETRSRISAQASRLAHAASEGCRRVTSTASDLAARGRGLYDKARDAVARGAEEAQRYVREATGGSAEPAGHRAPGGGMTGAAPAPAAAATAGSAASSRPTPGAEGSSRG